MTRWLLVYLLPVIITCGCFTNILAFAITCRGRLWRKSEGYVYLVAVFITNFLMLTIAGQLWIYLISLYHVSRLSLPIYRAYVIVYYCLSQAPAWLVAAFLFDVFVQRSLGNRQGQCCAGFARRFCRNRVAGGVVCSAFVLTGSVAFLFLRDKETQGDDTFDDYIFQRNLCYVGQMLQTVVPILFLLPLMFILVATQGGRIPDHVTQESDAYDSFLHFPRAATLCLVAVFWVYQFPYKMLDLSTLLRTSSIFYSQLSHDIIEVLVGLSYVLVPIVCLAMMPEFRAGVRQLFSCCRKLRPPSDDASEEMPLADVVT